MLTIYHVWTCDVCGHTERHDPQDCRFGEHVITYVGRTGWNWIDGTLVCPRHQLTIDKEKGPERKVT